MKMKKSNKVAIDRSNEKKATKTVILNQKFKPGDLTWVEIPDSSWWPAQVVDEGSVSDKPRKKSKNELLVRLYGTYEFMYVDASKSNAEFEDMLKRENKTMKEKFQEAVEQGMSPMLPKGESKLKASKSKGSDPEVSKDEKKQSELSKEPTGEKADGIATAMKVRTKKDKAENSSKRKRKLDFSNEIREEKETKPSNGKKKDVAKHAGSRNHENSILRQSPHVATAMKVSTEKEKTESSSKRKRKSDFSKEERESKPSKAETPNSKEQKVVKHAGAKNNKSSILSQSPPVASVAKTPTESVLKTPISENEEKIKAKDLEIRKIVIDILFGGIINPPKDRSPEISKDAMQGDTSNATEKSGLMATYSRKTRRAKQGDGEVECRNRKNEGVKEVVSEALENPNLERDGSCRSNKSNAEEVAVQVQSTSSKDGEGMSEKNAEGNPKAKSPELEADTPAAVKGTVTSVEKGSLSKRSVRVMQSLALIAPMGSPFGRNGFVL